MTDGQSFKTGGQPDSALGSVSAAYVQALHYLADRDLSLMEIALLLGYSEQSSFAAAFKVWMGVPPGEFRLRQAAVELRGA